MENKLLSAATSSREAFEVLKDNKIKQDFSSHGSKLLDELEEFYNKDPGAKKVDLEILKSRINRKFPNPKHQDLFQTIIDNFEEVSIPNLVDELKTFRLDNIKEDMRACLEGGTQEKLDELITKYQESLRDATVEREVHETVNNKSVESIIQANSDENLIKFLPDIINEPIEGGMLRGHHVLIFGRPDSGKSTLCVTLTRGFLKQDLKVLYIINEDPEDEILFKIMSSLIRMTKQEIKQYPEKAQIRLDKTQFNNLFVQTLTPGTLQEVEELVKEIQPDVLVVDQARNLNAGIKNRVEEMEVIERALRNMGKKYNMLTISVTQAGDSAHNKSVLQMNDVDWSNTAMQGAADLTIGLGVNQDLENSGRRMLSFPKNKRSGDKAPRQVDFVGKYSRIQ